jgi:hypothetical protein
MGKNLNVAQAAPSQAQGSGVPAWETWIARLILAGFVIVAFNAIHSGTTVGQDQGIHIADTQRIWAQPGRWFTDNLTFRPLLYWVGGLGVWFSNDKFGYELASVVFTLAGTAALALVHDAERRVIASPLLRVAGLALVAFLPLTVITTVVYAEDTAVSLPFILAGWGVMRCLEESVEARAVGFAALGGLGFVIGNISKATFLPLPAAIVFVLLALWRARRLTARRGWMLLGLAVVLPLAVGGAIMEVGKLQTAGVVTQHSFKWGGTGELTFRSLVGVKASDRRVFDAPEYLTSEVRNGVLLYPMLLDNNYSYPALLHLGIFTDLLNFANHAVLPRPEPQRTAARRSVRLGLVFSVGALFSVIAFWACTALGFIRSRYMPSTAALIWSSLAITWYLPIAALLPFVNHVYIMGYWLPRLVLPAIWIFFLSFFAAIDRLPRRWVGWVAIGVLAWVAVLSAAEIRSIWY